MNPDVTVLNPDGPAEVRSSEEIVLSELDRLRAENLQLRVMNEAARHASLSRQLVDTEEKVDRLRLEYIQLIEHLGKTYGFNPKTTEMEPGTGKVVPRGTTQR